MASRTRSSAAGRSEPSGCRPNITVPISHEPASSNPFALLRELWLDRAFIILVVFLLIFQIITLIKIVFSVSVYWAFVPLFLLFPFFLFYSRSITSMVSGYKEPDDRILAMASAITKVKRIVYGHTHIVRHEMIGPVEHLNSGCWSPAFLDIECTKPLDQKTFVWVSPSTEGERQAEVFKFENGKSVALGNITHRENKE